MGQNPGTFRSYFNTFRQKSTKIWSEKARFVPFEENLTHFEANPDIPGYDESCEEKTPGKYYNRDVWYMSKFDRVWHNEAKIYWKPEKVPD